MIGLINYGSGNLRSVSKALERVGARVELVETPEPLTRMSAVVLPGVGAFGDCVSNLRARALWEPLEEWLRQGKPFLGICLGYQMLFESSEESPAQRGFGFFRGPVVRFKSNELKVPHMGWNSLELRQPSHGLWRGLPEHPYVFFVHSYFPAPADKSIVTAVAKYGTDFAASVAQGPVAAMQFHPEKSQDAGLKILRNWVESL